MTGRWSRFGGCAIVSVDDDRGEEALFSATVLRVVGAGHRLAASRTRCVGQTATNVLSSACSRWRLRCCMTLWYAPGREDGGSGGVFGRRSSRVHGQRLTHGFRAAELDDERGPGTLAELPGAGSLYGRWVCGDRQQAVSA